MRVFAISQVYAEGYWTTVGEHTLVGNDNHAAILLGIGPKSGKLPLLDPTQGVDLTEADYSQVPIDALEHEHYDVEELRANFPDDVDYGFQMWVHSQRRISIDRVIIYALG